MNQALIKSFEEAKNIILEPIRTGDDDVDQMALIEAKSTFGTLIESTTDMLENQNAITFILKHNFSQSLNRQYECALMQEYQRRFSENVSPLLARTNVCTLKEF